MEELLLHDAISQCGFGNWDEIATFINKNYLNSIPKTK